MRLTNNRRPPEDIRREQLEMIAKCNVKAAKKQVLDELCSKIVIDQTRLDNGRIPYGFESKLVQETIPVCLWITRDTVMNHYRLHLKVPPPLAPIKEHIDISHVPSTTYTNPRAKGGRPV